MENNSAIKYAKEAIYLSRCHKKNSSMRLYEQSNENLSLLFDVYDVKDKDILTVLASSDQLLSCYYKRAKNIDTFDKVYISLYYYYLRKWLILYKKTLYPSFHFFYDGDVDLYQLICQIQPSNRDENEAKIFWKTYLENNYNKSDKYLFNIANYSQPKPFDCDINSIRGIYEKPLSFTCMDIFNPTTISKKYDVIILSNMLEYAFRYNDLIQARNNIELLLKDDGIAICSCMIYERNSSNHLNEVKIMTSHFLEIEKEKHTYYEPLIGQKKDLAYCYQLKRK